MILRWLKLQKPIAHTEKALEYVEKILAFIQMRSSAHPEYEVYYRIISQIEYIKRVLIDPNADRSKLRDINFGTGGPAGEILERDDPELYEALSGVNYIASQIEDGWEIRNQVMMICTLYNSALDLITPRGE